MSRAMNCTKQIEFEYNLDNLNREVVVDHEGIMPYYEMNDILMRREREWKVTQVLSQQSDSGKNILLTLYVSLTDKF
jgi:hypothetical protein